MDSEFGVSGKPNSIHEKIINTNWVSAALLTLKSLLGLGIMISLVGV